MSKTIKQRLNSISDLIEKIEHENTEIEDAIILYKNALCLANDTFKDIEQKEQEIKTITEEGDLFGATN